MLTTQIGAFEAKTHFSRILKEVRGGSDFVVTVRGEPVAKKIPYEQEKKMSRKEALDAIRELRKNYRGEPGDFDIRAAIEEGRR
jgi:prevent-host-death family protein